MSTTPLKIANVAKQLVVGHIIELFVIDATSIISRLTQLPGGAYAFHNSNDNGTSTILFQAVEYFAYPIQATGFEISGQGKFPRPTVAFSNVAAFGSALLREFNDLSGAKLTRIRTLKKFLDGEPDADPTQEMPRDIFYVARKVSENKHTVVLEFQSKMDVEQVKLPRGQLTANACRWRYRSGDGCDYAGPPVTDEFDADFGAVTDRGEWNSTNVYAANDAAYIMNHGVQNWYVAPAGSAGMQYPPFFPDIWKNDVCIKTLSACRKRFGQNGVLPFGAHPAILRAPLSN